MPTRTTGRAAKPTPPPVPQAVVQSWFPVTLEKPDGTMMRRVRVYATPDGLYAYVRPPADGVTPDWFARIDFEKSARPKNDAAARMNGVQLATDQGVVTLHLTGGCGCSNPLKRWVAPYAGVTVAWPGGTS